MVELWRDLTQEADDGKTKGYNAIHV
jgi:hypothetical protein